MEALDVLRKPFAGRGWGLAARRAVKALRARREALADWLCHGRIREISRDFGGRTVRFTTADAYSRWWWFRAFPEGYEVPVTRLMIRLLRDAPAFVDVGANLGHFTCIAARHLDAGQVFAFEMNAGFVEVARRSIELNGFTHVELVHAAVTDRPGELVVGSRLSSEGSLRTGSAGGRPKKVAAVSLDNFFAGRLPPRTVVKIDVEGAEAAVLQGMRRILAGREGLDLLIEIHPTELTAFGSSSSWILAHLIDHGFEVHLLEQARQAREIRSRRLDRSTDLVRNSMVHARR